MSGFAVSRSSPLSAGPDTAVGVREPVPFWDTVSANFEDPRKTRNTAVREDALRMALWERHRQAEALAGRKFNPSRFMIGAERRDDYLQERLIGEVPDFASSTGELDEADYEKQFAGVKGLEPRADLQAKLDARLTGVRRRAQETAEDHPVGAFLGQAAGTMTDPVNLLALAAGAGGARTVVGRIAEQAALNAAIEAVQVPGRMADAKLAGPAYTPGEAVADVAGAGVGAGVLQGLGEGLKAGGKALLRPLISRVGAVGEGAPKRAAQVLDQQLRDEAAVGPRDGAEHAAAVAALDEHRLPDLAPDRDITEFPAEPGGLTATEYRGRRIWGGTFDPRELAADPVRFQYKPDGDAQGVTARLKGVEAWDATASGKVIVWEDRAGQRFIADGHQRRGLALRMDEAGWEARLDGYLLKEADGWSARDARIVSALKNIREGSGQPLDAAKVLREAPEAIADRSLPVSGEFMSQARGLAQLSEGAFKAAVNKVIAEKHAAEIGLMAGGRPELHEDMVALLKEAEPANADEARALIVEALQDDWIKHEGDQADLFGYDPSTSAMIARAKVAAAVKRALGRDAKLFGQLVKNADAIEAGGNALARDANEARLAVDRTALEVTAKLALRAGPIGEAMQAAVAKVHAGEAPATAAKDVLGKVRAAIAAGERLDEMRGVALDPQPPSAAAVKALEGFDAAAGKGAEGQAKVAPEDAEIEGGGLFDDLAPSERYAKGLETLAACVPAE